MLDVFGLGMLSCLKLLDFQPAVVFVDAGKYLYSMSGDITKAVLIKLSLRFP